MVRSVYGCAGTARRVGVVRFIHIGLWITIRQAFGFTVERLRIGARSCESQKSCSVLHRAVHVHRVRLCIALRIDNSVRYGGYPL